MIYSIAGILIGAIIGGVIGYLGRCAGGTCPIACTPWGGIIVGALLGFFIATGVQQQRAARNPSGESVSKHQSP